MVWLVAGRQEHPVHSRIWPFGSLYILYWVKRWYRISFPETKGNSRGGKLCKRAPGIGSGPEVAFPTDNKWEAESLRNIRL